MLTALPSYVLAADAVEEEDEEEDEELGVEEELPEPEPEPVDPEPEDPDDPDVVGLPDGVVASGVEDALGAAAWARTGGAVAAALRLEVDVW
ncbi:hypothetical protein [Pedococcus sp. 2YAF34]|uniref:hypothetical protein n=1 Tax=Pedococcus sp. 2YAF34 TaxID=3233032 RepID=UPI003F9761AA